MSNIKIIKVENQNDLMRFIKFQWKIYKGYKHWVPPLLMDRKKLLDKEKNPFYKHAEADFFLAERNGEIAGRIGAIKNDLHNKY
ncbi:MAG TPA: hypothetical protein VLB50_13650, partial [Ignavibacteriaceae bacterium]|nr:hypothetical protein [Ignavibacteriaceae bacterium]